MREGALEAFLRLAGASTSARRSARGNCDAVALGRALIDAATRDPDSVAGRLRIARLSAATQRSAALTGRDPYSARHWYVANEVAFLLKVRKIVATAAVIAAVWRRICSGDTRWGDRRSLEGFWARASIGTTLPVEPPAGIAALLDRWGFRVRPSRALMTWTASPPPPKRHGEIASRCSPASPRATSVICSANRAGALSRSAQIADHRPCFRRR